MRLRKQLLAERGRRTEVTVVGEQQHRDGARSPCWRRTGVERDHRVDREAGKLARTLAPEPVRQRHERPRPLLWLGLDRRADRELDRRAHPPRAKPFAQVLEQDVRDRGVVRHAACIGRRHGVLDRTVRDYERYAFAGSKRCFSAFAGTRVG